MNAMPLKNNEPLWPQLIPAVPLWTNGKQTVQQYQSPGAGWFRIAIKVKEAA